MQNDFLYEIQNHDHELMYSEIQIIDGSLGMWIMEGPVIMVMVIDLQSSLLLQKSVLRSIVHLSLHNNYCAYF